MALMGTRDIKRKIKSINSTMQITKAMELVSTAKLKRAKNRLERTKPYFDTVYSTVQEILRTEKNLKHEFLTKRDVNKTLYIIITGDRGLCGGYNNNAMKIISEDVTDKSKAGLITIGKKSRDYFTKNGFEVMKNYIQISENPQYSHAQEIARTALHWFANEKVDEIKLVYTQMNSAISQEAKMIQLLPVTGDGVESIEAKRSGYTNYEPSPEKVLGYVIPKYIESVIYGALIESSASEQAARRLAMESASDNAVDMIQELEISFNKARQAAITQEISEIVGGSEALK
jgi:F-type H+-transporting ATPase subunit gamma